MKKVLFLSAFLFLLSGCNNAKQTRTSLPKRIQGETMANLLRSYNDEGYTKKTSFQFVESILNDTHYFHAGANNRNRATYYHQDEEMLLMGDYEGTFSTINSGYRNIENGIQHFKNVADTVTKKNIFTDIQDDWTYEGQSVGGYYPTLSSLADSLDKSEWILDNGIYSYSVKDLEIIDGDYNSLALKNFQYFAAPMLLQSEEFNWSTIRIKEESEYLSIKLYVDKGEGQVSIVEEGDEEIISEAKIYKGIIL